MVIKIINDKVPFRVINRVSSSGYHFRLIKRVFNWIVSPQRKTLVNRSKKK